jgi:pimeloyl-ACP methyl ester carboxylesterase
MRTLDAGLGLREEHVRLLDGRLVRTVVAGEGDPLVVFEAGLGVCASTWATVQRRVAQRTRTLAYDRAGLGGSDVDPDRRSLDRLVADLDGVLQQASPNDQIVLVGASLGGPILRSFIQAHPGRAAGLVFIDAAVAEATPQWQVRRLRRGFTLVAALSRVGLHKPLMRVLMKPATDAAIPAEDRTVLVRDFCSARTLRAAAREAAEIDLSAPSLERLQAGGLPDVPVTTLVGSITGRQESNEIRRRMRDVGRQEMATCPQGRFVAATRSSHVIPQQQPDLVADEVIRIVGQVRGQN